jgi:hypothetical protein
MIELKIDAMRLDTLVIESNGTPEQVRKALRSTVSKLSTWLRTRATRAMSAELQVKQKVLRFRLKNIKLKQAPNGSAGGIWLGLNDLDFIHLGGATQDAQGVNFRGREFSKAFMGPRPGTVSSKLKGRAFKRKGASRLPIEKVGLPIQDQANKALESEVMEWAAFETQFFKVLEHELKWRTQ